MSCIRFEEVMPQSPGEFVHVAGGAYLARSGDVVIVDPDAAAQTVELDVPAAGADGALIDNAASFTVDAGGGANDFRADDVGWIVI